MYLEIAKWAFRKQFLEEVSSRFGEESWPLVLWVRAQSYVRQGGIATCPNSKGLQDAILQDAALRHETPGPIRCQVLALSQNIESAMKVLAVGPEGELKGPMRELVLPTLDWDKRLAGILEPQDLAQEALLPLQEFLDDPAVAWDVGEKWPSERIQVSVRFARDVLARLAARKYGTDRQIERRADYIEGDEDTLPDTWAELAFEDVEQRMALNDLMEQLPPKQREAAEVQLRAFREGFSLEEMARRLGKDPKKTRENIKAAQRRSKN